ncbi:glycosyltransferase family 2 protein [uncultured Bacteroides sp.]|uniref:glycosyltransferase family 2 protein n=1 Tax=uncultured Bacteroides sp. TaxID=162156 RepID=UPI0026282994|nr:glycosyltransferase family 2 protein [uncultured Bacteroides sp.]
MTDPLISIIVPVYNAQQYIDQCIESIINQSYKNWELLLINDGSTDNSGTQCNEWCKKDQRIHYIEQNNQGVSTARNRGINLAEGTYITFIDSDDWVDSDYLDVMVKQITTNADLIVSGIVQEFPNHKIEYIPQTTTTFSLTPENLTLFIQLNKQYLLYGPVSKLYKSEIIKKHQIQFQKDYSFGEDLLFNYEYLNYVQVISTVKNIQYHYRILGIGTLSSQMNEKLFQVNYTQWKFLVDFYKKKDLWNQESESLLLNRLWGIVYDGIFLFPKLKNCKISYLKNILEIPEIILLNKRQDLYSCKRWIKYAIVHRFYLLFFLLFSLKKHS